MPVTINGSDGITNASWTTATRPSNPVAGQMGYNTDLGFTEVYNSDFAEWVRREDSVISVSDIDATGGTILDITTGNISYRVHSFTTTGLNSFVVNSGGGQIEYLVVAGGGAGNNGFINSDRITGGGGGAGGLLQGIADVTTGSYQVLVGAGAIYERAEAAANSGFPSSLGSFAVAEGGGGGGKQSRSGRDGGSGGGAGSNEETVLTSSNNRRLLSIGTQNQGNSGGLGKDRHGDDGNINTGGGGGGAGGAGGTPSAGLGLEVSITGSSVVYATGGEGGDTDSGNGANGTPNTGNGGGGAQQGSSTSITGGDGGSGIVIVRYRIG